MTKDSFGVHSTPVALTATQDQFWDFFNSWDHSQLDFCLHFITKIFLLVITTIFIAIYNCTYHSAKV